MDCFVWLRGPIEISPSHVCSRLEILPAERGRNVLINKMYSLFTSSHSLLYLLGKPNLASLYLLLHTPGCTSSFIKEPCFPMNDWGLMVFDYYAIMFRNYRISNDQARLCSSLRSRRGAYANKSLVVDWWYTRRSSTKMGTIILQSRNVFMKASFNLHQAFERLWKVNATNLHAGLQEGYLFYIGLLLGKWICNHF